MMPIQTIERTLSKLSLTLVALASFAAYQGGVAAEESFRTYLFARVVL
jgi:hypothetical protein